ncbi:hypothetical protein D2E25_1510 [Bifidobacterium goeldii]|uniref:DUF2207 domain-containing protein n=1 Tax=Bifidobacterium goeldii TaxID=2306975 RepID=A0A430FJ93_9BIFI|nr:DUF2207 domain-containing protein [Bifidobacterium goeldii]RSX52939.1 hypothetical protein D2E25_1510 [Bifidobacterium goeldii]
MNVKRLVRAIVIAAIAALATTLIVILPIGLFGSGSNPVASYRSLDYDVQVQRDGNLRITQHIDLHLRDRSDDNGDNPYKQVYQRYQLSPSNLTAITDISVTNATTGERYEQGEPQISTGITDSRWNSEYARHWYIGQVDYNDDLTAYDDSQPATSNTMVEIGWNIPATKSANSLKFDVSMTFKGVSTAYDDLVTFQWEPVNDSNPMPIGTLTGTVHFPKGVTAKNSVAWMHYEGTSETSRGDNGTLQFSAYDVRAGQYLDIVAGFDASAAPETVRRETGDIKDHLVADETRQETEWRNKQRTRAQVITIAWLAIAAATIALFAIGFLAARRNVKNSTYHGDIDYWREPPELSPASAAKLIGVLDKSGGFAVDSRQMSATILSLASKHAIAIYPGPSALYRGIDMSQANNAQLAAMIGADQTRVNATAGTNTIVIMPVCSANRQSLNLSESEDAALHLLETISRRIGSPVFDFAQMKAACKRWEDGYKELRRFTNACANEFAMTAATRSAGGVPVASGTLLIMLALAGIIFNLATGYPLMAFFEGSIPLFLSLIILIYTTYTVLTDPVGQQLAGQVLGLKRYMEDFSNFTDRGVADLTLWDRYLVYAAAFGISDKALEQLAKAYPQVADPQWLDDNASDSILYWNYRPYGWRHHYHDHYGNDYGHNGPFGGNNTVPSFDAADFSANFGDLGAQISSGFADIRSTIQAAAPSSSSSGGSGGSFSGGGGFGGSSGGSGGGSFGVR